jgi:hypothetical protein
LFAASSNVQCATRLFAVRLAVIERRDVCGSQRVG